MIFEFLNLASIITYSREEYDGEQLNQIIEDAGIYDGEDYDFYDEVDDIDDYEDYDCHGDF